MTSLPRVRVETLPFGVLPNGSRAELFVLRAGNGIEAAITNFGATLTRLRTPDRSGAPGDIVLGFDDLDGYVDHRKFFGATIGRFANRIAGGRFILGNERYTLATNNGPNHLHGGVSGFDRALWDAAPGDGAVVFRYRSPDGEEGYPGNLDAEVRFSMARDGALRIDYRARSDRPTPVNLTNHAFFNLGNGADILGHELRLFSSRFTPVDDTLIPTGDLRKVAGTPFDFREPERIGARIGADDTQLARAGGYDHNFVVDGRPGTLRPAAEVYDRQSGRAMRVLTTQPGIQFYSGNFLDGSVTGRNGIAYTRRRALCLETQHFPDSPNQPHFPSTILAPGSTYRQATTFQFTTL
ncbi:MAG TPA: aldose epimerase family protein [Burkholderiales bacterium]|nr:aldose epimerase family protein [Burkholderiales bacterium]